MSADAMLKAVSAICDVWAALFLMAFVKFNSYHFTDSSDVSQWNDLYYIPSDKHTEQYHCDTVNILYLGCTMFNNV